MEIAATIVAYLTNPIVALFADEYGNLPKALRFWQTFDNCLDVGWMIDEDIVPKCIQYDFHKHYIYHLEDKHDEENIVPGYVEIIDGNFTFKEKVQRYFCRLAWLYRNCNYGFSHEINGVDVKAENLIVLADEFEEICICYDKSKPIWTRPWCYYYNRHWCKWFKIRIYLGWKLKSLKSGHHMLALFVHPFRK